MKILTMSQSAVTLLPLMNVVTTRDSCEDYGDYLCGDVCIDRFSQCHCGDDIVRGYFTDKKYFCCIPPREDRQQCHEGDDGVGHCPEGRRQDFPSPTQIFCAVNTHLRAFHLFDMEMEKPGRRLPTTDQCHGECFNDYRRHNTTRLGWRSRYKCEDGQCAIVQRLCRDGYAACQDKGRLHLTLLSYLMEFSNNLDPIQLQSLLRTIRDHYGP